MNTNNKFCVGLSRLLASFIILASLLVLPKAQAAIGSTFTVGQLKYTVYTEDKASQTGTVSVESISKEISGDIAIPASLIYGEINYSVTLIPDSAFRECSKLTSITIPDSVTDIGYYAFRNCSKLTSVVIGNSVTGIGNWTFHECSKLTSVVIGDSVTSIGWYAFRNCSSLTSITIPDSVTSIGGEAFSYCTSLTSITIPDSVTSMGDFVFAGCSKLTSITIPDSVTSIGGSAFINCSSLTSITIPDSVTSIGYSAFDACTSLTSITIPDSVTSIGNNAFYYCSSLTSVVIGDSVTSIGGSAFCGCSSLTSITIPDSVTSMGNYAFYGCTSLTSITIPDSVTSIGENAFSYCSSLTSVVIGDSVTSIGENAFSYCSSLTSVYFEGNAPALQDVHAFFAPAVIYYRPGTTGWTNPWDGRPATLWIESPEIVKQPKSQAVIEGDAVTFSVIAEGTEPLSYQWYKEGTLLEGAATASYTIESVSAGDLGNYTVVVTNELGVATSDAAVLSYLTPPTITVPPVSLTVDAWTQAIFRVEATGADNFQWYKNDVPISGATNALYTIDSVRGTDVGTYKVVVTNRAGIATSTATLTLTQPYRATGTVQVVNGYVVGLSVTDGGWGYTREPRIRIKDETGGEATGHCVIENGVVTQIILDNPGSNYSGEATVLIGSPLSNSSLRIGVSEVEVEMSLVLGMEYQLWSSVDCIDWTPVGEPFTAEEEEMTFFFKVADYGRFFKLQEI